MKDNDTTTTTNASDRRPGVARPKPRRLARTSLEIGATLAINRANHGHAAAIEAMRNGYTFRDAANKWTDERGHAGTTEDEGEALLLAARPWETDATGSPATSLELYAVPRGATYDFTCDQIDATLDCFRPFRELPFDAWIADAFWEVDGINPAATMLYGPATGRIYPGPVVFAGESNGETVSLPSPQAVATLAHFWTLGAFATARACDHDPARLLANGGETMDLETGEPETREIFGIETPTITTTATTPAGVFTRMILECANIAKEASR